MNYKQINENWQRYLNEEDQTLGDFVAKVNREDTKNLWQKLLKAAKVSAKLGGAIAGGAVGSTVAGPGGGYAGAVGGAAVGMAIEKVVDKFIENNADAITELIDQYIDTPDDQRGDNPLANFFDLNDEMQAALRGGSRQDGPLMKEFRADFRKYLADELSKIDWRVDGTAGTPLSDWITDKDNINTRLKKFVKDTYDPTAYVRIEPGT